MSDDEYDGDTDPGQDRIPGFGLHTYVYEVPKLGGGTREFCIYTHSRERADQVIDMSYRSTATFLRRERW